MRLWMSAFWLLAIAIAIRFQPTEQVVQVENIILRKFFHALAVIMFVPAMVLEVCFCRVSH